MMQMSTRSSYEQPHTSSDLPQQRSQPLTPDYQHFFCKAMLQCILLIPHNPLDSVIAPAAASQTGYKDTTDAQET